MTQRDRYLQKKYGITEAEYDKLLAYGDGRCWACYNPPKPGKNLHVDHDHKTRKVRALLCWPCNQLLRSYATPQRLEGLARVAKGGVIWVEQVLGHNGNCAPVKRKKRKGAKKNG